MNQKITPFLWFDSQAEEATKFYVSVFKNSEVLSVDRMGEDGPVFTTSFRLNGEELIALNGGPLYKFNESVSFLIDCKDQEEVDYFWDTLSAGWRNKPVRVAEGQVRALLAGCTKNPARGSRWRRCRRRRSRDAGDDADDQAGRRQTQSGIRGYLNRRCNSPNNLTRQI